MKTGTAAHRAALTLAITTPLILIWMNGAVGVIGADRDRADLMYAGVALVGIVGAAIARLRPRAMAIALAATALAQIVVTVIALVAGMGAINPAFEIVALDSMFVALLATSAWLFQHAASVQSSANDGTA